MCMHVDSDDMLLQAVFQAWLKEHKADRVVTLHGDVVSKTLLAFTGDHRVVLLQAKFQAWAHGYKIRKKDTLHSDAIVKTLTY